MCTWHENRNETMSGTWEVNCGRLGKYGRNSLKIHYIHEWKCPYIYYSMYTGYKYTLTQAKNM